MDRYEDVTLIAALFIMATLVLGVEYLERVYPDVPQTPEDCRDPTISTDP